MKTKQNVTFSLPVELVESLNSIVEKGKSSLYVTKVLTKAIDKEKLSLKRQYEEANNDPDRLAVIEDWKHLNFE